MVIPQNHPHSKVNKVERDNVVKPQKFLTISNPDIYAELESDSSSHFRYTLSQRLSVVSKDSSILTPPPTHTLKQILTCLKKKRRKTMKRENILQYPTQNKI